MLSIISHLGGDQPFSYKHIYNSFWELVSKWGSHTVVD